MSQSKEEKKHFLFCSLSYGWHNTYGLYYEDQDISGYSRDAVSSLIHTEASNNKTITITIPNQGTRQVKVKDLGITLDTTSTESNIFTYGYEDDLKMLIMHRITAFYL